MEWASDPAPLVRRRYECCCGRSIGWHWPSADDEAGAKLGRRANHGVQPVATSAPTPKIRHQRVDLTDEATIASAAEAVDAQEMALDLVFVASGILHDGEALRPEKTWRALEVVALERVYQVNAIGPRPGGQALPAAAGPRSQECVRGALGEGGQHFEQSAGRLACLPGFKGGPEHVAPDVRDRAGVAQSTSGRVGLHPGTVNSRLSAPFQANVPEGKPFTPGFAASRLLDVLDRLTPEDSGKVFAWDGEIIPP